VLLRGGRQQRGALRAPPRPARMLSYGWSLQGRYSRSGPKTSTEPILVKQLNDQCGSEKTMHKQ
jgi:hypothetical protein